MTTPNARRAQAVLYLCLFLHVFTEMLFAPFFPQLFARAFGVAQLEYTGLYVAACRLTVVAFAPVWALLSQRFEVRRLLPVSQLGAAVFTACLPLAANEMQFLLLSIALLAFKSGYLLVYSLAVELAGEERRTRVVGAYQGLFHLAVITSTLASAWAIQLAEPLRVFYVVACLDLLQGALCLYALRRTGARGSSETPRVAAAGLGTLLIPIGFLVFTFHLAANVMRPYFTSYTGADPGLALPFEVSAVLFLLPSVLALVVMPWVRRIGNLRRPGVLYAIAIAVLSASTLLQGMAEDLITLFAGRVAFGLFFVVAQALIEMYLFRAGGANPHFNYGVMVAVQNTALLAAPLLASVLVEGFGLAAPLLGAAMIFALNLAGYRQAIAAAERPLPFSPTPKENHPYASRQG